MKKRFFIRERNIYVIYPIPFHPNLNPPTPTLRSPWKARSYCAGRVSYLRRTAQLVTYKGSRPD